MKKCTGCQQEKSKDQFHWRVLNKEKQSRCKECAKAYCKRHYESNKADYYHNKVKRRNQNRQMAYDYLKAHPCVDCGEADPVVLEFDHQSDKFKTIAVLVSETYGPETIMKEIRKCQIRCANCHRRKTATDFEWYRGLKL